MAVIRHARRGYDCDVSSAYVENKQQVRVADLEPCVINLDGSSLLVVMSSSADRSEASGQHGHRLALFALAHPQRPEPCGRGRAAQHGDFE